MAPSTLAGTIQAISGGFSAVLLLAVAIIGFIRSRTVESKVDKADARIAEVHVIVNHQRDVMQQIITDGANYNRALIAALDKHGIEVPIDQSAKPTSE